MDLCHFGLSMSVVQNVTIKHSQHEPRPVNIKVGEGIALVLTLLCLLRGQGGPSRLRGRGSGIGSLETRVWMGRQTLPCSGQ